MLAFLGGGAISCSRKPARQLRVGHFLDLKASTVGFVSAIESGYFSRAGMEVERFTYTNPAPYFAQLIAGQLDVMFTQTAPPLINAVAKGVNVRIVAGRESAVASCSGVCDLYARRASFPAGLASPGGLKGKKISINGPAGLPAFALHHFLKSAGLGPKDVETVFQTKYDGAAALTAGTIDALIMIDSVQDFGGPDSGIFPALSLWQVLPGFQHITIAFGPSLIEGPVEKGRAFLAAYLAGCRDFFAGKSAAAHRIVSGGKGVSYDTLRSSCTVASFAHDGRIDTPSVDRYLQWAHEAGLAPLLPASKLIDTRFLP